MSPVCSLSSASAFLGVNREDVIETTLFDQGNGTNSGRMVALVKLLGRCFCGNTNVPHRWEARLWARSPAFRFLRHASRPNSPSPNDAAKAERLIRNLAQRLEREAPGVSGSLLEGLDEILTVTRLGLPAEPRRSLACTNIIENMMGTVRRINRNVKHWSSASMALRWTAAAMLEAKKGFRRLKAYKQLPTLRAALIAQREQTSKRLNDRDLDLQLKVA
jgi:hypothetical protein